MNNSNWEEIRDSLYGYGFYNGEKTIFAWDLARLLNIREFDYDLDLLYERLEPLLVEERRKRLVNLKENPFTRIYVPLVRRSYPNL